MKREIVHFTDNPETQGIAEVKAGSHDNAYGVTWADAVREYLKTGYGGEEAESELESFGKIYKVLRMSKVTAFYDKDGNTLFDVTNERLQKEYEWLMANANEEQCTEHIAESEGILEEESEKDEEVHKQSAEASDGNADESTNMNLGAPENNTEEQKPSTDNGGTDSDGVKAAIEKLKEELKNAKQKDFAEPIIEYLINRCKESESLAKDILRDGKTWGKCFDYIFDHAKKYAKGARSAAIRDDVVCEWAEDYYHLDDKSKEEKKPKGRSERKQKAVEKPNKVQKEAEKSQRRISKTNDPENAKETVQKQKPPKQEPQKQEPTKQKAKKNELEGQMDLFSMFGM